MSLLQPGPDCSHCILALSLMLKRFTLRIIPPRANECFAKHHLSNMTSLMCQVLTDNSDTPFEHLQPEEGVDDAAVPVHPFQQRIAQLDIMPPSILARLLFSCYCFTSISMHSDCLCSLTPLCPRAVLAMKNSSVS